MSTPAVMFPVVDERLTRLAGVHQPFAAPAPWRNTATMETWWWLHENQHGGWNAAVATCTRFMKERWFVERCAGAAILAAAVAVKRFVLWHIRDDLDELAFPQVLAVDTVEYRVDWVALVEALIGELQRRDGHRRPWLVALHRDWHRTLIEDLGRGYMCCPQQIGGASRD